MRPGVILTRGRAAQIASAVGIAGLVIGLIGLVWRSGSSAPYATVALVIGIAGIIAWAALTPREFMDTITGRRVRYGTVTLVSTLLLLGIVVLTYLLLGQAAITLDVTQNQSFTLSDETLEVLDRVRRPMQITGFYTARSLQTQQFDDQYFRLYEAATDGLIQRQYIDPEENPAMAERFGVTTDGQLYLSYLTDTGEIDMSTLARIPITDSQERDITGAIARLLIAGTITVYFDTGHDERDPLSAEADGLSGVNNGIRESGLITQPIDIAALAASGGDVPADAAALIFARPLTDLSADEIALLDRYLEQGGSLLLLTDPTFGDDRFLKQDGAFNQYLWDHYGLRALDAAVVDPDASGDSPLDVISAAVFPDTDIGARLDPAQGTGTLFRLARAVEVNLDSAPEDVANGRVIMTTTNAYGETDLARLGDTNDYSFDAASDLPGPLTTVAWSSRLDNGSRVVLIGDSDFVTNGQVMTGGNSILFTDALAWLSHFNEEINFAPQAYVAGLPTVFVTQQEVDFVVFLTVILVPGAVLVFGLAVWTRRSRR